MVIHTFIGKTILGYFKRACMYTVCPVQIHGDPRKRTVSSVTARCEAFSIELRSSIGVVGAQTHSAHCRTLCLAQIGAYKRAFTHSDTRRSDMFHVHERPHDCLVEFVLDDRQLPVQCSVERR